jgi:hypothetical protein
MGYLGAWRFSFTNVIYFSYKSISGSIVPAPLLIVAIAIIIRTIINCGYEPLTNVLSDP